MGDRQQVRLMSDYSVGWPLWGSEGAMRTTDLPLSADLATRIHAWQEYFEAHFHYDHGWRSAGDDAAYAKEGHVLRRLLIGEIGEFADVELDLWPTTVA